MVTSNSGTGTLMHCSQEYKTVEPLWKTTRRFLEELNLHLRHDPGAPLLGIDREK